MKILIDTNILISGLFFGGLPKKLLSEIDEKFNVCVNEKILSEYNEQIDRKVSNPKYKLITPTIKITKNCKKFLADVKCE
ncbi:MAG: hypothetical protein IK062_02795 [Selenomonadaceae bacterium]|nr:hypothetical protein [Selenomonadaceae bacterium]